MFFLLIDRCVFEVAQKVCFISIYKLQFLCQIRKNSDFYKSRGERERERSSENNDGGVEKNLKNRKIFQRPSTVFVISANTVTFAIFIT